MLSAGYAAAQTPPGEAGNDTPAAGDAPKEGQADPSGTASDPTPRPAGPREPDPTPGRDPFRDRSSDDVGRRGPGSPPPWSSEPTSVSGTLLEPTVADDAASSKSTRKSPPGDLEHRVRTLESRTSQQDTELAWLRGLTLSGFVQPQLVASFYDREGTPNAAITGSLPPGIGANDVVATPDGSTTNSNTFRLRRARLKVAYSPVEAARVVVEIDALSTGGEENTGGTIARQVEAQGIARWSDSVRTTFAAGMFRVPFGYEITEYDPDRIFIERTWGARNMFPGQHDIGARARTTAFDGRGAIEFAVVNGTMLGERSFRDLPDLTRGKDAMLRAQALIGPVEVGLSGWVGQGALVDPIGLRYKRYSRFAGNVYAAVRGPLFCRCVGESRLIGSATLGQNMDRGTAYGFTLPTFPATAGGSAVSNDQQSLWIRGEQEITRWVTLGARFDSYSPNTAQSRNTRNAVAGVVALHFTKGLSLLSQLDYASDKIRAPSGNSSSRETVMLSTALLGRF